MMTTLETAFLTAFLIILYHTIADFIFQDEKWAVGKSKSLDMLLRHTVTYSLLWYIPIIPLIIIGDLPESFYWFPVITFVAHTITDFFTSKLTSYLYAKGKFGSSIPNIGFFTVIGFDQVLHYAQLYWTYVHLNK